MSPTTRRSCSWATVTRCDRYCDLQDHSARLLRAHGGRPLDTPANIFRTWNRLHGVLKERYYLMPEEDKEDALESCAWTA
jgi:hypothetical protein